MGPGGADATRTWMPVARADHLFWDGDVFRPASRFDSSLIKLVPTEWGAPTFEIDGIKMLPTLQVSPFEDAARKVALIEPRGKVVLDTCGGLGISRRGAWLRRRRACCRSKRTAT